MEQPTTAKQPPPDDYYRRTLLECSTALTELGVHMSPGMVLSRSVRMVMPIFENLVVKGLNLIATEQKNIRNKASLLFIVFVMMRVILFVRLADASLGHGLWFSIIIHHLCFVIYLCWLRKKEQALEKYRVKIAEFALEVRMILPMVEVDNVEADQWANDLINMYCYMATIRTFG